MYAPIGHLHLRAMYTFTGQNKQPVITTTCRFVVLLNRNACKCQLKGTWVIFPGVHQSMSILGRVQRRVDICDL